jgi:hypothetical protein
MMHTAEQLKGQLEGIKSRIEWKMNRGTPVTKAFAEAMCDRFGDYSDMLSDYRNPDAFFYARQNAVHAYRRGGLQGLLDLANYKLSLCG